MDHPWRAGEVKCIRSKRLRDFFEISIVQEFLSEFGKHASGVRLAPLLINLPCGKLQRVSLELAGIVYRAVNNASAELVLPIKNQNSFKHRRCCMQLNLRDIMGKPKL